MIGKSTDNTNADYRRFFGGNYSRDLNEKNERPKIADMYNKKMGASDDFDKYVHRFSLRFLPLKNKYSWVLKPILNIIEF